MQTEEISDKEWINIVANSIIRSTIGNFSNWYIQRKRHGNFDMPGEYLHAKIPENKQFLMKLSGEPEIQSVYIARDRQKSTLRENFTGNL